MGVPLFLFWGCALGRYFGVRTLPCGVSLPDPEPVIPAQAGIQFLGVMADRADMDTGIRRYDDFLWIELRSEIAPAFFALRASHFSLLVQRKVTKRKHAPARCRRVASGPARRAVLGARGDTTSCRDAACSASMPRIPCAQPFGRHLARGGRVKSGRRIDRGLIRPAVLPGSDAWLFLPRRERRIWEGAQGLSGQDVRESAVATGCRVGTTPSTLPKPGTGVAGASVGRAFFCIHFLCTSKEKYVGPQAEKRRCDFAVPVNRERSVMPANAGIHTRPISSCAQKLGSGLRRDGSTRTCPTPRATRALIRPFGAPSPACGRRNSQPRSRFTPASNPCGDVQRPHGINAHQLVGRTSRGIPNPRSAIKFN